MQSVETSVHFTSDERVHLNFFFDSIVYISFVVHLNFKVYMLEYLQYAEEGID